jgi:hypothetical protein
MRGDFEITCEGLGEWNRRATWLLHFRQRADRPNRFQEFKVGGLSYPANLKGRAWIAADSFQILRIESELVNPIPQVGIINEHQMVEYGPVPFQKKNIELWLPKHAEIYLDFKKHHYFRRHNFDNFKLFSVDAEEKIGDIKQNQSNAVSKQ